MTAYLNIGSNMGDRRGYIDEAIRLIAETFPKAILRLSDVVESEPWGFESTLPFLNIGVALDYPVDIDPFFLLATFQDIERRVSPTPHRNADGSYRDRCIDIDIIAIDCLTISSDTLTIPHPRAAKRPFVMEPLRQLAPPAVIKNLTQRRGGAEIFLTGGQKNARLD